jgi:hypothetical protein
MANQIRNPDGSFKTPKRQAGRGNPPDFHRQYEPDVVGILYWHRCVSPKATEQEVSYRIFVAQSFRVVTGRSIILTQKDSIGLGPVNAKMGDVVCVVRGCKTPIIRDGVYRLVGDSYAYGIMDGSSARAASWLEVRKLDIK